MFDPRLYSRPIAYHPWIAKELDSITAAVLLCQLIYWQGTKDPELNSSIKELKNDGWVWKTQDEWVNETAAGKKQIRNAIRKLKEFGLIEVKEERLKHRTCYRIDKEKLEELEKSGISRSAQRASREVPKGHLVHIAESTYREYADPVAEAPVPAISITNDDPIGGLVDPSAPAPSTSIPFSPSEPPSLPSSGPPPVALAPPFVQKDYLETMLKDKRDHIKLISLVFTWTDLVFPSKAAVESAIRQNLRAAVDIAKGGWDFELIQDALEWMMEQPFYKEHPPNCATLQKELPKQVIRNKNK